MRATRRWLAAGAALVLAGCELDRATAPTFVPRAVVYAVLDPALAEQLIIVEATRTSFAGEGPPNAIPRQPISGARVVITGPGRDSVIAVEELVIDRPGQAPVGSGYYRVPSEAVRDAAAPVPPGVLRLVPGGRYRLRVETPLGAVRGETQLPVYPTEPAAVRRSFNVDRDTLWVPRMTSGGAAAGYIIHHDGMAGGNMMHFTRVLADPLLLPADLTDDRPWAFSRYRGVIFPGTAQMFTVVAVDTNYVRYHTTLVDPFGDGARGNTLEGGVGLFGSAATLVDERLELVADRDHAIEGEWRAVGQPVSLPRALHLYESPRFPGVSLERGELFLTGRVRFRDGSEWGTFAEFKDGALRVRPHAPSPREATQYTGTLEGTTLTLELPNGGERTRYQLRP